MIRLHDTMTRQKVELRPRRPGEVSMYVCGPTVYDEPHLGHARTALTYDLLRRFLEWEGLRVVMVSNITDIDDKIIARAAEEGRSEADLAEEQAAFYIEQMDRLNILPPTERPRATEYVQPMIDVISDLLDRGAAYGVEGRGVYFDVARLPGYGRLAGRNLAQLLEDAGSRVSVDEAKHSPLDFALWKAARPGEPRWDTPWGEGRPGWHTECVAMSMSLLGEDFDIHGGGDDLRFPHHQNEWAQVEATGRKFARLWVHSAMLNVSGEKMSKSLGNFTTLAEALDIYDPRAMRLLVAQTHYRATMEMGPEALTSATEAVKRLDAVVRRARAEGADLDTTERDESAVETFRAAMEEDLGTPGGVEVIFSLVRAANTAFDRGDIGTGGVKVATMVELAGVLGLELGEQPPGAEAYGDDAEIQALVDARTAARQAGNYAEADRIRDDLAARGVAMEDTRGGTVWHRI